jgi:hypothetical protein
MIWLMVDDKQLAVAADAQHHLVQPGVVVDAVHMVLKLRD